MYGGRYPDEGRYVIQTDDGGYIIAGYTYETPSSSYGAGIKIIKTNSVGQKVWTRQYGGPANDWANCIIPTSDGGYIIAGGTELPGEETVDACLIKIDAEGYLVWRKSYGGYYDDAASSVVQTSDGGYAIAGWTNSFGAGYDDVYVVKTDADGDTLWTRTFGDMFYDKGYTVKQTSDGNLIIVGGTGYFGYWYVDVYLIKINMEGDSLWTRSIGSNLSDAGRSLVETPDGGFMIAGWTMGYSAGAHDVYLVKTDSTGEFEYSKIYGGEHSDVARFISSTSDGGFLVTGYTNSFDSENQDIYVLKTDSQGDTIWTKVFGGSEDDYGWAGIESDDGGYAVTGWTMSYDADFVDAVLFKLDNDQTAIDENNTIIIPEKTALYQNYPNPFNPATNITFTISEKQKVKLKVYDLLGREVAGIVDEVIPAGTHNMLFDASQLSSGVYIYRLQADDFEETKRMVLLK